MDTILISKWIAMLGGIVVLLLFILLAISYGGSIRSSQDFLFAKHLPRKRIASNISATATSLAGAFLFFFTQTSSYGWIMFIVIALTILGHRIFAKVIENVELSPVETGSIYRFLFTRTGSIPLAKTANIIVVSNFVVVLLIELVIGASVFSFFFPGIEQGPMWSMFFLGLIALVYIIIGGFEIVAQSDYWQFRLIAIGIILALLLTSVSYFLSGGSIIKVVNVFKTPQSSFLIWGTFLINAILINLTLPTCQISSWQRFASSESKPIFISGLNDALLKQIGFVWLGAILLSAIIYSWKGPIVGIDDIFTFLQNVGMIGRLFVFPVFFVGLLCALISTIDSLLISVMLGFEDFRKSTQKKEQNTTELLSENNELGDIKSNYFSLQTPRCRFFFFGIITLVFSLLFYVFLNNIGGEWSQKIIQLMFAGYGQAVLIFPILWYSVMKNTDLHSLNKNFVKNGLILGFLTHWIISFWGIIDSNQISTHLAPVAGFLVVVFSITCGAKHKTRLN